MADPNTQVAFGTLTLDTTPPQGGQIKILEAENNGGRLISNKNLTLQISCTDPSTTGYSMKVWGILGNQTVKHTGDGTETEFDVLVGANNDIAAAADIVSVTVGSTPQASGTDYTYNETTGKLTFTTAPAQDAVINIIVKDVLLTKGAASSETFALTKTISIPETEGTVTVYASLFDDVGNETADLSVSYILDMSAPEVHITFGPDPNKISRVPGKDVSTLKFQATEPFKEFKVKIVSAESATHDTGTPLTIAGGSDTDIQNVSGTKDSTYIAGTKETGFAASTDITVTIKGDDLYDAVLHRPDGDYIVKVFVKDMTGNWSV